MSDSDQSEPENYVEELIPNDHPGHDRKGSFKRRKAVNDLTSKLKRLKYFQRSFNL